MHHANILLESTKSYNLKYNKIRKTLILKNSQI
jgi:hypothetical protein